MITIGSKVKVHYTGKLENNMVFDTSVGKQPIEFEIGSNQVIKGFEDGVIGLEIGDKKNISINPEDAYGLVREDLIFSVEKSNVPSDVQVGSTLQSLDQNNKPFNVVVREIKDNEVLLDANHPLAGQKLDFEVQVVDIL